MKEVLLYLVLLFWKVETNKTKVICANSKLEKNWGLGEVA